MTDNSRETLTGWIDGAAPDTGGRPARPLFDPADATRKVGEYVSSSREDLGRAIMTARQAQAIWSPLTWSRKAELLGAFLRSITQDAERIATAITDEMGKRIGEARAEVGKAVGEGTALLSILALGTQVTRPSERSGGRNVVDSVPLGVIGAINPWNFPFSTPMRKIMPALAAGNAIVLKPSELTPGALVLLAQAASRAGLPDGLVNVVLGTGAEVGGPLMSHDGIDGISFTGSTATGRKLAIAAAERLMPIQLELGGKNAAIVLESADLDTAADAITRSAMACTGQRCTAISRVIAHHSIAAALQDRLVARFKAIEPGPGHSAGSGMGPLVTADHRRKVQDHVDGAARAGHQILTGGKIPDGPGNFYPATLVYVDDRTAPIVRQEVFGPVVSVQAVHDLDEALAVHADSRYGLSAAVFTTDQREVEYALAHLRAGMLHVNGGTFPENNMPFGGMGDSGLGAPSVGVEALAGFSRTRALYM